MFLELRRLTRHTLIYGVGHIFSGLVGFLLIPLHTNLLPKEALGALAVLRMALAFGHIVVMHGLEVGFVQYFAGDRTADERRTLLSSVLWAVSIAGGGCGIILWCSAGLIAAHVPPVLDWAPLLRLCAVIIALDAVATPLLLALRAEERSRRYVAVRVLELAADLSLNIVLVGALHTGVLGVFWSQLLGRLCALAALVPGVFQHLSLRFSRVVWRQACVFGLPATAAGMALLVIDAGDRYFITRLLDVGAAGIYFAGYRVAMGMALLIAAFRFAWHPFFLSIAHQDDAPVIYARVMTYYMLIGVWVCLLISLLAEDAVYLEVFGFPLFGRDYLEGIHIVPLVAFSYLLYGAFSILDTGVYLSERTGVIPVIISAGALINVTLNYLLIPRMHITGAALATVMAYAVLCVLMYAAAQRRYPIGYDWRRIGILLGVGGCCYGIAAAIDHLAADLAVLGVYPAILLGTGFFHHSELLRIYDTVKRRLM